MQRARLSLPTVTFSAVAKDRRMIFLQFDPDQAPILHSGQEVPPTDIICYPLGSEHHYRTSTSYHCGGMSLTEEDFAASAKALCSATALMAGRRHWRMAGRTGRQLG